MLQKNSYGGVVFSPTTKIDCCNTNALGYQCDSNWTADFGPTDDFGSLEPYQTFVLTASNLFLLLPALKLFISNTYYKTNNKSIVFLNLMAMIVSFLYHLCKTNGPNGGGACLLHFCTLKNLDYSFSNTLLVSLIFFLFPFAIQLEEEETKGLFILEDYRFIENYVLCFYFWTIFLLLDSTLLCTGNFTMVLFLAIISSSILIAIVGHCIIIESITDRRRFAKFNKINTAVGFTLVLIAAFFFVIEDYMDKRYYWITHSLWHIFASLAQLVLLDARNQKRTLFGAFCFLYDPI